MLLERAKRNTLETLNRLYSIKADKGGVQQGVPRLHFLVTIPAMQYPPKT